MSNQNPLLPPKSAVAFFLGGAGGVFGIASSVDIVLHPFGPIPGSSGLDFGIEVLNLSVYFTFPAALIAIFGAMLTLNSLKDGGIILLIASVIGMLGSIVPVSLASSVGAQWGFFLFLTYITVWWWDLMILTAGVLALVRVHEFQKRITNSQARVNPVKVPP